MRWFKKGRLVRKLRTYGGKVLKWGTTLMVMAVALFFIGYGIGVIPASLPSDIKQGLANSMRDTLTTAKGNILNLNPLS